MQDENRIGFFVAVELTRREARRVYPLVRLFHPSLTLEQWLTFAQATARAPSGMVAIEDHRACIHAAFIYKVDSRLARGPLLRITDLMVGRLPGGLVNHALMDSIERLARETEAETIEITLPSALEYAVDPAWRAALTAAGFSNRATSMIRRLSPDA